MIWSSSKAMHQLTTSQLQNYQMECNRYKPLASAFCSEDQRINSLTAYLNEFLLMFMVKLQSRRLQLSVQVDFGIEVEQ